MPKEPQSSVVPETEWDKTPMAYHVMAATDEDGQPVTGAAKAAATRAAHAAVPTNSGTAAESKEK